MPRFILYFPFHEQKRNTFVFHHDDMLICIRVDAEVHRNYNIAFLVWDKDNLSANDLMGCGYLNLASVFRTKGNYDKAIEYLNLGLKLENSLENKAKFYSDLAINYMFLDEVELIIENINKSNKLNSGFVNSTLVRNLITEANWFLKKGEINESLAKFHESIEKAKLVFVYHYRILSFLP